MKTELSAEVIKNNGIYEGVLVCNLGRKLLWKQKSGILRSTEYDAVIDAKIIMEDYLSVNNF